MPSFMSEIAFASLIVNLCNLALKITERFRGKSNKEEDQQKCKLCDEKQKDNQS